MNGAIDKSTFLVKSSKNSSFGTGFCVHKDEKGSFFVTCAHVVEACGRENLQVDLHNATLLHISNDDAIVDLALIYVEGLTDTVTLKLSAEIAQKYDAFEIDGFRPHKNDQYRQEPLQGIIKKVYPILSAVTNEKVTTYDLTIGEEDTIEKGYSGSPVMCSQTGLVIAIATDRKTNGKQAYATPALYLKSIWKDLPSTLFTSNSMSNPYKGLNSFGYKDQHNYYGREAVSQEIATTLKTTKLFTLLGASGSGKSSLIFAGILPLIEEDGVEVLSFRPLNEPFKSLASVFIFTLYADKLEQMKKEKELSVELLNGTIELTQLVKRFQIETASKKLYLIIDQFEELYTLTKEPTIRNAFLDQLLTLINSNLDVTLLISMRADFLSYISYYEPFSTAYDQHPNKILTLLNKPSLKNVIEQPALKLGVTFQDGLVDRIINEIEHEAGQLPLLEFALDQLWLKKKGRVITHDVLDDMKSISHSISHYADNFYEKYPNKQESIKKVFMKLVTTGCGEEDTRRVASLDEFNEEERETIVLLANERLVVTEDGKVDIVHEAFIREWKRLYGWIESYREFLEWEKRIRDDKELYINNKEKKEDLLKESKLLRAKEFLKTYKPYISSSDRVFIEQSIKSDNKQKRNRKLLLGAVFVFLLAIIWGVWRLKSEADKLNEKLVTVVNEVFGYGTNISEKEKLSDLEIYQLIIDEFKETTNGDILELVEYSYYNIGNVYYDKQAYDQAIEAYQKAVEINPKNDEAYYNMGLAYHHKQAYDQAIEAYKKAIEINPKKDEAYYNMGNVYANQQAYDQAIEAYKKAIEINPKRDDAYYNMGLTYYYKQAYDQAIEAYQKAIEINPKKDEAYYNMGNVYANQQAYDQAIEAYQKAIEINPKKDKAYLNMGRAYYHKQAYDQAIEAYQKAIEINLKNDDAYYGMGVAYYNKQAYDQAIEAYQKAIEINPERDVVHTNLFELQLIQNQPFDQALEAKYGELFGNKKETFIHYEMLKILQDVVNDKKVNVEEWKQKYHGVGLGDWGFDELNAWIDGMQENKVKTKLLEALKVFKGHKVP